MVHAKARTAQYGHMDVPEVRYARSGDVSIAYQAFGEGPVDLVVVRGSLSELSSVWDQPLFVRHAEGLASFARVLMFDKRGMGLSDRLREVPTLETRMDDIRAVMDDAGVGRAAIMAAHEGTRIALLFAASYPERTSGLVLHEPSVRGRRAPDYPWARSDEEWRSWLREVAAGWGTNEFFERQLAEYCPTVGNDPTFRAWYIRHMRSSASPGAAASFQRMVMDGDVNQLLPSIRVPTLVTHRPMSLGPADYVTSHIPGAIRREIPGLVDGFSWADPDANQVLLDETERFLRGLGEPTEPDMVLGTFLFTDIAGSTERAAELGDVAWRRLLDRHHALVRHHLAHYRGTEAGTAGDGFFATFDGPGRAIRCACAIRDGVRGLGLEIRAGLHTGEGELRAGEVSGIAVHIAARVAGHAEPGEVLVSSTVRDLVAGSQFEFVDRGTHAMKGLPGDWQLYAVCPG
jgi:class 3 adenylate cyclase/alpha-beta hydrolase superfamily lysophospholipase